MKKLAKYFLIFMTSSILILLSLLLLDPTEQYPAAKPTLAATDTVAYYHYEKDKHLLDSLKNTFGYNKQLPKGFELAALRALSHYPELQTVPINFVFTVSDIELQSRPEPLSVLLPWKPRIYQVLISTDVPQALISGRLDRLPYNAQIGVLGHELAHTLSYLDKSSLELTGIAFQYASFSSFREQFEQDTDRRTIKHQLGHQLKAWSKIVHPNLEAVGKGMNYMSPEEISRLVD